MGCGVLETSEKNVPGTALLTDDDPLASVRAYGEDIDVSGLNRVRLSISTVAQPD